MPASSAAAELTGWHGMCSRRIGRALHECEPPPPHRNMERRRGGAPAPLLSSRRLAQL
jgi:hypothetical protein